MHLVKGFCILNILIQEKNWGDREERMKGTPATPFPSLYFFLTFFFFSRRCTVAPLYYMNAWNRLHLWIVFKMYPFFICVNFI